MEVVGWFVSALGGYLLGSIPTGYLVGRACGIDVREAGSGNIGATNVFRLLGKTAGTGVLLVDALKGYAASGFLATWIGAWIALPSEPADSLRETLAIVAGIAAILGHNFTCWLRFRGGKGIATSAGVLLALVPQALAVCLLVWAGVFAASRYVSVASITAAFCLPFVVALLKGSVAMISVTGAMAAMAIVKHRANIRRLLDGIEHRVGSRPPPPTKSAS